MGQDAVHGVPRLLSDHEEHDHDHDHEHLDIDDDDDLVTYRDCEIFLRKLNYSVILRYF